MSIQLEWAKLDSSLASHVVEVLNRQLTNIERPSFIGPIEVTSLDFGSTSPDVQLVDLRDIYRDFLEDDDDDNDNNDNDLGPIKVTQQGATPIIEDEDDFEWVSRRAAARYQENHLYRHLPPHVRYHRPGLAATTMPMPMTMPSLSSLDRLTPNFGEYRPPGISSSQMYRSPTPSTPFSPGLFTHNSHDYLPSLHHETSNPPQPPSHVPSPPQSETQLPLPQPPTSNPLEQNPHPNLQLHLRINWHSNLRITLTTSLLINYPSPMFMSLPIKLSVTGIVFDGEVAVAYEGERRRVHLCVLDDLDPYGPASDRPKPEPGPSNLTPPELDDETPLSSIPRPSKPQPIGQRLLPSIFIESEIGQADKHVLKNVTRVERFIQDVIRKTVEEELVFPNFHTLLMEDPP